MHFFFCTDLQYLHGTLFFLLYYHNYREKKHGWSSCLSNETIPKQNQDFLRWKPLCKMYFITLRMRGGLERRSSLGHRQNILRHTGSWHSVPSIQYLHANALENIKTRKQAIKCPVLCVSRRTQMKHVKTQKTMSHIVNPHKMLEQTTKWALQAATVKVPVFTSTLEIDSFAACETATPFFAKGPLPWPPWCLTMGVIWAPHPAITRQARGILETEVVSGHSRSWHSPSAINTHQRSAISSLRVLEKETYCTMC